MTEARAETAERWGGVVLCGGQSRRMGRPKALLDFFGEPLLPRVARSVQAVVGPVVVVAAPGQDLKGLERLPGVIWARDREGGLGPLAGIAAGLAALPEDLAGAYVCPCDAPLVMPAWIRLLIERIGRADIAMPRALGHRQPLAALYRRSVAETARRLTEAEGSRPAAPAGTAGPVRLADEHPTVFVEEPELRAVDPALDTLRNANTPAEYAELQSRWRARLGADGSAP